MLFFEQGQLDKKEEIDSWQRIYTSQILRGGVLGAIITAFLSWNRGRIGRIGTYSKRWKFIRYLVSPKPLKAFCPITNYHHANLDIAANNFYCYSGESGIGVSHHFQQLISKQSFKRPTLYVNFKAVGREVNFENDLSQQINFGQSAGKGGIVGQIVRAIRKIHQITSNPKAFLGKYYLAQCACFGIYGGMFLLSLPWQIRLLVFGSVFVLQAYFSYFMGPLVKQVKRGTIPVLVFDDLNKLQHLGMLAQITRFFKIVEAKAANIMLISSNQETWSKLRREPGMKDRLRVRHIKYDHAQTAKRLIGLIDEDPAFVQRFFTAHPLISHTLLKEMARAFIGQKQMSIRRFSSVLKLADEEEYEKLVQILKNDKQLTPEQVVTNMRQIIFESEVQTMVTNFRSIKRQLQSMSQRQFIDTLQMVVRNKKLPSDSKVGALLRVYNILRDLRSEYVINGGYMLKIFELAFDQYRQDWREYQLPVYLREDD